MKLEASLTKLRKLNPCPEAIEWIESARNGSISSQALWDRCERGDWMLWLCGKLSGEPESQKRKLLVKASCGCARLALKWVKKGENRPLQCIETAEAWADGKATIAEVRKARAAAYAAYAAYDDAAAYDAAYAAYAAAGKKMLKDCSDVVRKFYPKCPICKAHAESIAQMEKALR